MGSERKILVAARSVSAVLSSLPEERPVGLTLFGARGGCDDVALAVPARSGSAGEIVSRIQAVTPRGKTPLAEAIRLAADFAEARARPVTLVLLSDGKESCRGDPCAVARHLEATSQDLTIHVIGFRLKGSQARAVSCIASATGGRFFAPRDAAGLVAGLRESLQPKGEAGGGILKGLESYGARVY